MSAASLSYGWLPCSSSVVVPKAIKFSIISLSVALCVVVCRCGWGCVKGNDKTKTFPNYIRISVMLLLILWLMLLISGVDVESKSQK